MTTPTEREPKRYTIRSAWNASILKELDPSMHIVPESVYLAAIRERDEAIKLAERITSRAALNEAAREKAESELAEARRERDELAQWKREAMLVETEWDCQAIARELDMPLGCSIRRELMPAILKLKAALTASVARERELEAVLQWYAGSLTPEQLLDDAGYRAHAALHPTAPAPNVNDL